MPRFIAPIAVIVSVIFLGGLWWLTQPKKNDGPFAQCQTTSIASDGNGLGGPFELINAKGKTVTDEDIITEPSLIYFGYTFCPDVCPLDISRNVDAVDILAERAITTTPIFISIDPERDTPKIIGDFSYNLHEKMIGLTGSEEQVAAVSKAYKTYFKAHDKSDEFYLVDHSTFTYLVFPEYGFMEFFRRDVSAEVLADRVACFVKNI